MKNSRLNIDSETTVVKNGRNDYTVYMQTEGYGCVTLNHVDAGFLKEKFNVVNF